jgi:hypothetical protein
LKQKTPSETHDLLGERKTSQTDCLNHGAACVFRMLWHSESRVLADGRLKKGI